MADSVVMDDHQDPSPTTEDLRAEIAQLRAELADLRVAMATAPTAPAATSSEPAEAAGSRRQLLKLAGAAVVGTVASSAIANRAAAEVGYSTAASVVVPDAVLQVQSDVRPGKTAFVFATNGFGGSTTHSAYPGALGGWSYDALAPHGVYGYTAMAGGAGVVGFAATGAPGVKAVGDDIGLEVNVTGVAATAARINAPEPGSTGAFITSGLRAIEARSLDGGATAVKAVGTAGGVQGEASEPNGVGVTGSAFGADATGVAGIGGHHGVQGYSESGNGLGGQFAGLAGAIRLAGWQTVAPPARTRAHERGVLETTPSGDLWFCYQPGAPGKWRKLAGPATAGAFHPIAPGRVYDSRRAAPAPGVISTGSNRTISVADRRNVDTGAVVQTGLVPVGATAVAANVTIVSRTGAGYLVVNPGGRTTADASTINWTAPGQVLANGVIVTLGSNRDLTIVAGGNGSTHFLIDVTGYWL